MGIKGFEANVLKSFLLEVALQHVDSNINKLQCDTFKCKI